MNDDSCPECDDVGLQGGRWPCMEQQQGCIEVVWPYFQTVWTFSSQPVNQTFRIEAFRAGQRIAMTELGVP